MAGWVKFDNGIGGHPKVLALADDHYLSGLGLQLLAVCYCDQHRTDGFIPGKALRRISPVDCDLEVDELVRAGIWDVVDGGYRVHDYLVWQRSAQEIESASESARRAAYARHGKTPPEHSDDAGRIAGRIADGNAEKNSLDTDTDTDHTSPTPEGDEAASQDVSNPKPETQTAWRDFLEVYPKPAGKGDSERFASLTPALRQQAISAAHEYVATNKDKEARYFPSVENFLSDPTQLDVLGGRWDKKLADKKRKQAAEAARFRSGTGESSGFTDEQWDRTGDSARKAKAALEALTASHTIGKVADR